MDLFAYLDRIGFVGDAEPTLATLRRLQHCHLAIIPYENFDVQLGRTVPLDRQSAYAKLVTRRRGGWCYEMNGLFGWALEAIGFCVMPMTGAVMRAARGASSIGNHLVLCVELETAYLVDVGVGDGPIEPIPIRDGSYRQGWRTMRIERLDDGWWRFHNCDTAFAPSFDFRREPADWDLLGAKCAWQQSSPESRFVQNAICARHLPDAFVALVGRVLKRIDAAGSSESLIASADAYVTTLATEFDIRLPEAAELWPKIVSRHEALFGQST